MRALAVARDTRPCARFDSPAFFSPDWPAASPIPRLMLAAYGLAMDAAYQAIGAGR